MQRSNFMRVHLLRVLLTSSILAALANAAPVRLRCESLQNPLGINMAAPHLSWQSDSTERNWSQSAYQILVASSANRLRPGSADIWDSGKVTSAESVGIAYGGPKLEAKRRYYWAVRVWDEKGHASQSSEQAWWETGLRATDWKARWIAWKNPEEDADRAGIRWIWVAGRMRSP
jgi:alpha-L-rhamnosidase